MAVNISTEPRDAGGRRWAENARPLVLHFTYLVGDGFNNSKLVSNWNTAAGAGNFVSLQDPSGNPITTVIRGHAKQVKLAAGSVRGKIRILLWFDPQLAPFQMLSGTSPISPKVLLTLGADAQVYDFGMPSVLLDTITPVDLTGCTLTIPLTVDPPYNTPADLTDPLDLSTLATVTPPTESNPAATLPVITVVVDVVP